MLVREIAMNGVGFYVSPLLRAIGVPHAFSTRIGGISSPPFNSLNLGNPSGCDIQDDYAHIWDNYRLLQSAAGCPDRELLHVHQIHGAEVLCATRGEPFNVSAKGDVIVLDDSSRVASVRVADCVPVLFSTADGKSVAAAHAGWKGVIAGTAVAAIKQLTRDGAPPPTLIAAIGPSIGYDAFEVGPEVLQAFEQKFGPAAPLRRRPDGKGHVDLRAAIMLQLLDAGLQADRIDTTDRCTVSDVKEFFSHRRDNGVTGRMAAIISPAQ